MTKVNYLLIIVAWLVAAGFIIIPRIIFKHKQPISVDATLADVAHSINSIQVAIYSAMGIKIGIILTVMVMIKWYKK